MAIYLNPGYISFEEELNSEIYVDKTEMILHTNSVIRSKQKYMSISRPRRFGKSYAADMLCAYYGKPDSSELFKGCKVAVHPGWDRYLGRFDVIRLVMTRFFKSNVTAVDALASLQKLVCREICNEYPDVDYADRNDLIQTIEDVYYAKQKQFVIVIDEWDAIFREKKNDTEGQTLYLDFLRDWLKDKEYIALAYMTGILPIKKYGKHSALNMFTEYSMVSPRQLAPYTGFTEDEVRELCRRYGRSFDSIREWYNGYEVSDIIPPDPDHERQMATGEEQQAQRYSLYSPLSVVNAVITGVVENYWNLTENYEALAEYIRKDFDGLKEVTAVLMDGGRVKANIRKYQNDMTTFAGRDDVLALLIHLGYLGYDNRTGEVFIPNKEILDVFKDSTESPEWVDTFRSFRTSMELLEAIWTEDAEKTAELMELSHDRTENKTYNNEAALSYGIQYGLYAAQKYYTTIQELDSGKGYADLVYLPSPRYPEKPALVVELKYNKDVRTAADQVRDRNYPQILEHYAGNILIVSVNYDKESKNTDFKRHSCRIVRC
ncbi:MAG: ATP-binding protein [Lachnospiraceae bacterium]|nr:ATP-binding protein [Lachnospiraceae bacterium]